MARIKRDKPRELRRHYLKEWREKLDITQERAMDGLDWSQSKISRIENMKVPLTIDDLYQAAEYYGRSAWELINVNPLKEREVVDAIDLWPQANEDQRKRIADYARYLIEREANDNKKAG